MLLGVHISGVKKLYEAFDASVALGCTTMQIFAQSPQRWQSKPLSDEDAKEFIRRQASSGVSPVFIHAPYLINLASPDKTLYENSITSYIRDIFQAGRIKADYYVTHMGSHKETSEKEGIERLVSALNRIQAQTKDAPVTILLENTAGSGSSLGYTFSHHAQIFRSLTVKKRFGLCLDTAHAFAAGYDIRTQAGLTGLLAEIDKSVGLEYLKLVHLNDSLAALGSRVDRHQHIGKGAIGLEGMAGIVNHPRLKNVPFILETPKETEKSDRLNLAVVKKLKNSH
jgi:deoxyribonuclease IV